MGHWLVSALGVTAWKYSARVSFACRFIRHSITQREV